MSEETKKVRGVKRLPIFPLPMVLMPFELLSLHIFEPRYRDMLKDVQEANNLFGVSWFEHAEGFDERPEPDSVGCVAEIRESQTLEDGRSNILTAGIIRYRVVDFVAEERAYDEADIEFFEDEKNDPEVSQALANEVFALFEKVAEATNRISGQRGVFAALPKAEPDQLSFLMASAFNLDNESKYELIKMRSTSMRLGRVKEIISRAGVKFEESAQVNKMSRKNGHANKPYQFN